MSHSFWSRDQSPEHNGEESTVSWQSAFWGVFLTAINTFAQDAGTAFNPTDLSERVLRPGRILRLSPFICIVHAICTLFTFAVFWYQHHVRPAGLIDSSKLKSDLAEAAEQVLRRQGIEQDKTPVYVRVLLAFAALTQMAKLSGMQGIPFTTFCAWCYFIGYLVVEVMRGLVAKEAVEESLVADNIVGPERSLQYRLELAGTILLGLAFLLHVLLTFALLLRLSNTFLIGYKPDLQEFNWYFVVGIVTLIVYVCRQVGRLFFYVDAVQQVREAMGVATMAHWMVRCFVIVSIAIVFVNYVVLYKEEGTYKPAWTELLG